MLNIGHTVARSCQGSEIFERAEVWEAATKSGNVVGQTETHL